ncbi:hypothetical protein OMW55_09105 [Sphingomonas sp. BN140010]|uniref:Uncharacterized protein n=1 Tax=Sphingomonas arvum TaxID=2992113 RepID=A0ABT3JFW5_9SPHN|nr:hypothetical protein [Sphingomonas sp. BN140010]MCW3797960.1 hypothetical protein [Sphingomonas sp. BN140010]
MSGALPDLGPEWLAHRYAPSTDAVHWRLVTREERRKAAFLTDEVLGPGDERPVPRAAARGLATGGTRANFIFHSAYCCSTLLANACDRPGQSFSLKEPVILNDLTGWRLQGAPPARIGEVMNDALAMLARPFATGEACVIKPSNVANGLAPAMIAARPEGAALLLYAPLRVYLGSIASKGLWGRLWVRDLAAKQLKEGLAVPGIAAGDYFLQSDLQVAALGWLAQHALFARIAASRPSRVRTLDSELLLAEPDAALERLDALFGVADDETGRAAVIADVFSRNAKSGEAFSAGDRAAGQRSAEQLHGDEIDKVHAWALAVAQGAGIAMSLPQPLLG